VRRGDKVWWALLGAWIGGVSLAMLFIEVFRK
jgi:hypothetical protein